MAEKKSRKRGQGEGSIYQRSDGQWVASISSPAGRKVALCNICYSLKSPHGITKAPRKDDGARATDTKLNEGSLADAPVAVVSTAKPDSVQLALGDHLLHGPIRALEALCGLVYGQELHSVLPLQLRRNAVSASIASSTLYAT